MTLSPQTNMATAKEGAIASPEKSVSQVPAPNAADSQVLLAKLVELSQSAATGRLTLRCGTRMWFLFFELGYLTWASSREHQGRRWQRQYARVRGEGNKLIPAALTATLAANNLSWDYQLSFALLREQLLSEKELGSLASGTVREILFDILHAIATHPQVPEATRSFVSKWDAGIRTSQQCFIPPRHLEPTAELLESVRKQWSAWHAAGLTAISPNDAPYIVDADRLRSLTTARAFAMMARLFDGQRTLRDIAVAMKMSLHQVVVPLLPPILNQVVYLEKVGDCRPEQQACDPKASAPAAIVAQPQPHQTDFSVLCIDDNLQCCEIVKHIVEGAGYRCTISQEPLQAVSTCMRVKPDLIFLDLVMPVIKGYELCAQLRRTESFKQTPIIILSGYDGIPGKMRAKFSGATEFISKPIMRERVVAMLEKYARATRDSATRTGSEAARS